ncbi:replication/maintenance protein RepL [Romboutsia lituseburensis]|uniref:replication/maintenance protein RepL n=1 Tax=Romboutsia lituseburensis TaxID=1537 RepID=UPI00215AA3D8|nr:replication/maintenance protein RepL [Romboutsia lituseburensis]MCR8747279.1 replication/maintenance protein RepL [Romboutsia lituseburensis]
MSATIRKINQMIEKTTIDENGNKLKTETNTVYSFQNEPPYVKMYLDTILYLKDLPKGHNPILMAILKRLPWANQDQDIALNAGIKRKIATEVGCSVSKVNNAITDLVKGDVLFRTEVGVYKVNPHLFGRGEWNDIAKLRLEVTFDSNGKTILGTIEKNSKI